MSASQLDEKVEEAFVAVLTAAGIPGVNLYRGHDDAVKTLDSAVAHCVGGPEYPRDTGNRKTKVELEIRSGADALTDGEDAKARHAANSGAIIDAVKTDTIAADLTAAISAFHVFDVREIDFESGVRDRTFFTRIIFQVYCCGATVT